MSTVSTRLSRLGLAAILVVGAIVQLVGPWALARAARAAEAQDFLDCQEVRAPAHPATTRSGPPR